MSTNDRKHLLEKAILELSPFYYGKFQYTPFLTLLKEAMEAYEKKGSGHKAMMIKLKDALDKMESKIVDLPAFTSETEYNLF